MIFATELKQIAIEGKSLTFGKRVGTHLYYHVSTLVHLPISIRLYIIAASMKCNLVVNWNIAKIDLVKPRISLMSYPTFEEDAHPRLNSSVAIGMEPWKEHIKFHSWVGCVNPPILHRKELFVHQSYMLYTRFCLLTRAEEAYGLYDTEGSIGHEVQWNELLKKKGLEIIGHKLRKARNK